MGAKNKTLHPVQWYDLLLKACREGDEPLLDEVLKNLDDCTLGKDLPLFLAMGQPHFPIVKKLLKVIPQFAASAFLSRIRPHPGRSVLTSSERSKLFKCVLPHFNVPIELDPDNKNSNWWSYAVFLMTSEELEQIAFCTENHKHMYDKLTFYGLRWCLEHSNCNTADQILKKVQWVMRHNLLSEDSMKKILDHLVRLDYIPAAFTIAQSVPNIKALSFTTVDTLLRSKDLSQLHKISPLFVYHGLDLRECQNVLQKWGNGEYRINSREYGEASPHTVDVIYPFIRPLAAAEKTHVLLSVLKDCSMYIVKKLRKDFPKLWDWDEFYIHLCHKTHIAPTPQEEQKIISPSHWVDYVTAIVQSSKGVSSFLFNLKTSEYHNSKVISAILESGNKALVNKCLFEGGKVDGYEMWLKLANWADESYFTEIWKQSGAPSILTDQDLAHNEVADVMESVLKSPLSHVFMSEDKAKQWIEGASNKNLVIAAKVAARQKAPAFLNALLQKATLDLDDELRVLSASVNDIETLKVAMQYIDPHIENSQVLSEAAENNYLEAVNFLIPLCNPKADNSAALRLAAGKGHIEVVKALIPVTCPKDYGSRALMAAIDREHIDVALLLWPHSIPKEARTCVDSTEFFDKCAALWQKSQIEKSLPSQDQQKSKKGRKI